MQSNEMVAGLDYLKESTIPRNNHLLMSLKQQEKAILISRYNDKKVFDKVVYANTYAFKMFDFSKDEILLYDFFDLFNIGNMSDRHLSDIKTELIEYKFCALNVNIKLKNGCEIPYRIENYLTEIDQYMVIIHILEMSSKHAELYHMNENHYIDYLTKLPNRRFFQEILSKAIDIRKPENGIGLLILNISNLKNINLNYGSLVGDKVIKIVAHKLLEMFQKKNICLCQTGDNEFGLIFWDTGDKSLMECYLKRINLEFEKSLHIDDLRIYVEPHSGVSIYPINGTDYEKLLRYAYAEIYKLTNSNNSNFFETSEEIILNDLKKINVSHELKEAIKNRNFISYYQPVIDVKNNHFYGAEALVRWNHPTRGITMPSDFISISEKTDLIGYIDKINLRNACEFCKRLKEKECYNLNLSVNISAKHFYKKDFIQQIDHILTETRADPKCLAIEITESTALDNIEETNKIIRELKKMGIKLSMDDFGKGYSSLCSLKNINIDILKIDKDLVDDITDNKYSFNLLNAVIDLAHKMGIEVIVEGIESKAQYLLMKEIDCDYVQGYYFSKPINDKDFTKFIKSFEITL